MTCADTPQACGQTLSDAIALGGDIFICPGEYRGGFSSSSTVRLFGAGNGDDPAKDTILDGNNDGAVFNAYASSVVTLSQMRLTHGLNFFGGGAATVWSGGELIVEQCVVDDNAATSGAGGLYTFGGRITVRDTTLSNNSSPKGGGGLTAQASPAITIANCVFSDNSGDTGAGANLDTSTVTIASTTFTNNTASAQGGGLSITSGTVTFSGGCQVTNNTAVNGGGIAGTVPPATITLGDTVVSGNSPDQCYGFTC